MCGRPFSASPIANSTTPRRRIRPVLGAPKAMPAPMATRKNGKTRSAGVTPCQGAWVVPGKAWVPLPWLFTTIIPATARPRKTSSERSRILEAYPPRGMSTPQVGFRLSAMASFRELLAQTRAQIREVDTTEAAEAAARPGTVVLDVREPDEYEQGAIPGAIHIPRGHLESQVEGKIPDRAGTLIVHCASGYRSAIATSLLCREGLPRFSNLVGGLAAWTSAQLPTIAE